MHIRSSLHLNWKDYMEYNNMKIWHRYKIGELNAWIYFL
jgi:hypothetical protein